MCDSLGALAASMVSECTMLTASMLLESATPQMDTLGQQVAEHLVGNSSAFDRGMALLLEGPAGTVENVEELIAIGLPAKLEGGLAAVASEHREALVTQVKECRKLRAVAKAVMARRTRDAIGGPKLQGQSRRRGEYDKSSRNGERKRMKLLVTPTVPGCEPGTAESRAERAGAASTAAELPTPAVPPKPVAIPTPPTASANAAAAATAGLGSASGGLVTAVPYPTASVASSKVVQPDEAAESDADEADGILDDDGDEQDHVAEDHQVRRRRAARHPHRPAPSTNLLASSTRSPRDRSPSAQPVAQRHPLVRTLPGRHGGDDGPCDRAAAEPPGGRRALRQLGRGRSIHGQRDQARRVAARAGRDTGGGVCGGGRVDQLAAQEA